MVNMTSVHSNLHWEFNDCKLPKASFSAIYVKRSLRCNINANTVISVIGLYRQMISAEPIYGSGSTVIVIKIWKMN